MAQKRISFVGNDLEIDAAGRGSVNVSVLADMQSLLDEIDVRDVVAHFDKGELLDAIGEKEAREHFEIE